MKRGFSFNKNLVKAPKRSKFNLSHDFKFTFNAGKIIPILCMEGLPGDSFSIKPTGLVRMQSLLAPTMHVEDLKFRFFKVPLRLLAKSDEIQQAFTGGKTGEYIDFPLTDLFSTYWLELTTDALKSVQAGSLFHYLGLPLPFKYNSSTGVFSNLEFEDISDIERIPKVSPFPILAYLRVFHDWFRNEETLDDFEDVFEHSFTELTNTDILGFLIRARAENSLPFGYDCLLNVCWERDYFTSALSSTQRGSQVTIPLLGNAPVTVDKAFTENPTASQGESLLLDTGSTTTGQDILAGSAGQKVSLKGVADVSSLSGIGAIALRTAMNLQAYLERSNISGYRYIEKIFAFFGVKSSDARMQMAEYLGGGSLPFRISSVAQTSATESNSTPQANLAGLGAAAGAIGPIKVTCEEHCIILGVAYALPRTGYSQGLSRMWTRKDYTDYYWEQFQTIGEQEILNREIFFDYFDDSDNNDSVWAYQSRYSEYKYMPDRIAGDFSTSLAYWHKSRLFSQLPQFNNDFVTAHPTDRTFAVLDDSSEQHYLADLWFDIKGIRPMNKYNISKIW